MRDILARDIRYVTVASDRSCLSAVHRGTTYASGLSTGREDLHLLVVAVADEDFDAPLGVVAFHALDSYFAGAADA